MQVQLLQSLAGAERSWQVGEMYECDEAEAGRLIEAGIAAPPSSGRGIETATAPTGKRRGGG